jgi:hypothetical protein
MLLRIRVCRSFTTKIPQKVGNVSYEYEDIGGRKIEQYEVYPLGSYDQFEILRNNSRMVFRLGLGVSIIGIITTLPIVAITGAITFDINEQAEVFFRMAVGTTCFVIIAIIGSFKTRRLNKLMSQRVITLPFRPEQLRNVNLAEGYKSGKLEWYLKSCKVTPIDDNIDTIDHYKFF